MGTVSAAVNAVIRPLDPGHDASGCEAVIRSLPYHFGDPNGRRECAAAVRREPGWVIDYDGEVVAFVTRMPSSSQVVEITWLAVAADHRRSGLGRQLVEQTAASAEEEGFELLCALTIGPSDPEEGVSDGYAGTREFWKRTGFTPVKEMNLIAWGVPHTLLLVRSL
jgi:GNAT superfamily N-acetyltransferase